MRVMVTNDLIPRPYQPLFFQRGIVAMSITTGKLRLGPLLEIATVKVTFACTTALKAGLDRYATLHAKTYGEPIDDGARSRV